MHDILDIDRYSLDGPGYSEWAALVKCCNVDPAENGMFNMEIRYCARMLEHFGISTAPVVENGEIKGKITYDALVLIGMAAEGNP